MRFVLDCSVAISWFMADEDNAYANAVWFLLSQDTEAIVPDIWWLEIANVLLVAERRQRSTTSKMTEALAILRSLPILVDTDVTQDSIDEIVAIARNYNLAAYDAAYLELAAIAPVTNELAIAVFKLMH